MGQDRNVIESSHAPGICLTLGDTSIRYPKELMKSKRFSPIVSGIEKIMDFVGNSSINHKLNTSKSRQLIGQNLKEIYDAAASLFSDFLQLKSDLDLKKNNSDVAQTPGEKQQTDFEIIKKYFDGVKTNFENVRQDFEEQNMKLFKLGELNDCLINEIAKQAQEMAKLKTVLNIDGIGKEKMQVFNTAIDKHEFMAALWHPLLNKSDSVSDSVKVQLEDRINDLERALKENQIKIKQITEEMRKSKEGKSTDPSNGQETIPDS